jgi:hypothetical protein
MSYRQKLIRVFTFLGGLYFFLQFVLPATIFGVRLDAYDREISDGFVAIGAMAVGLGLLNLLHVHGGKIVFRRSGWVNSLGLIFGLVVMVVVTALDWRASAKMTGDAEKLGHLRDFGVRIVSDDEKGTPGILPLSERSALLVGAVEELLPALAPEKLKPPPEGMAADSLWSRTVSEYAAALGAATGAASAAESAPSRSSVAALGEKLGELSALRREVLLQEYRGTPTQDVYSILYDGLFVALGSAMFSLLGFYIAAAAYRAFRVRSAESALMMIAALLVMLGQIPFGLWVWEGFPEVRLWLLSVPSTAAFRAIKIGAAVAGLILAFRVWFSIESESFSRGGR